MKRYIGPLCMGVGFLVLCVWVFAVTEVKEDTGYGIAAEAGTVVAAEHAADESAAAAHGKAEVKVATKEQHAKAEEKVEAKKPHAKAEIKVAAKEQHAKAEVKVAAKEQHAKAEVKVAAKEQHAKAEEKAAPKKQHAKAKVAAKTEEKAAAEEGASGGGKVADVIAMNNPKYKKHKKGICDFTHKKHAEDYKISCGSCHHDKEGKPLESLKMGDDVLNCIACHKKAGKAKVPKGEKWSKEKKREFHADAVHDNCIPCHKTYNKENKTKAAPASCKGCHPQKKK